MVFFAFRYYYIRIISAREAGQREIPSVPEPDAPGSSSSTLFSGGSSNELDWREFRSVIESLIVLSFMCCDRVLFPCMVFPCMVYAYTVSSQFRYQRVKK